jgi:DNA repair protein RecN (Recombination protein N)
MLHELRIDQFAIIPHLELTFQPGLTTFTGETGAGKSIILDAIVALVGGKTDATIIRAGADRATVEAEFALSEHNREEIHRLLEAEGLLDDPNTITLGREVRREGRTIARVNGRSVNLNLLRELGSYLVDIHGQSEHLSLLNVRQHLGLLDRFASTETELSAYQQVYHELQGVRRELGKLRQAEQDAVRKTDLLTYQVQEIEAAHLQPEEEEQLRQERARLANAEALAAQVQQSLVALDEGGPEALAVSDLLGQVVQSMNALARMDESQQSLVEQAESLADLAVDLARDLRAYQEQIEYNPRRLEQLEERLELFHTLKRKYGSSLEAVLAFAVDARQQLETIAHASERIEELEKQETVLLEKLSQQAQVLSVKRAEAAVRMEQGVERELNDLSMAGAHFKVDMQTQPQENGLTLPDGSTAAFDETGLDRVEFLIAPNPGEGLKPLVKIASGGETSRLMLALKNVLVGADYVPTLIFDEIDQGISGRVGVMVGEKLWQLGRQHQVLCVTHLPQLAAYGDQHLKVSKHVDEGRTSTSVDVLEGQSRQEELALMMGGVTDANRAAAQETLRLVQARTAALSQH